VSKIGRSRQLTQCTLRSAQHGSGGIVQTKWGPQQRQREGARAHKGGRAVGCRRLTLAGGAGMVIAGYIFGGWRRPQEKPARRAGAPSGEGLYGSTQNVRGRTRVDRKQWRGGNQPDGCACLSEPRLMLAVPRRCPWMATTCASGRCGLAGPIAARPLMRRAAARGGTAPRGCAT
jgi:hypothetical protein